MKPETIKILIPILIVVVIALTVVLFVISKKKKTQAEQPIHKDYDPSIDGTVNKPEEAVQQVETTPAAAPTPVVEESKQEPELNFESKPDMPQLSGETQTTVAPEVPTVTETPTVDTTPIMEVPTTPVVEATVSMPTENPVIPEVPVIDEPVTVPVVETPGGSSTPVVESDPVVESPAVVDTTPIMEVPTTPVVEQSTPVVSNEPVVVPTLEIPQEPAVETPKFENVGMVAEPVIEAAPVVESPVIVPEPVPVIEEPVIVPEPVPEVAQTAQVQVLDNYEITLPEEQKAIEVSQNMSEQNIEKGPMFVTDTPVVEQPVVVETTPEPIAIDVPEIEEIQ